MTEYKPFSGSEQEPPVFDRTVAAILSLPASDDTGLLAYRAVGSTSLAELALETLAAVEADERWLLAGDNTAEALLLSRPGTGVSLLRSDTPPEAGPSTSHLLLFGPFHPFLRPSSLSEAVRLFKMRTDLASLEACLRNRDALYDSEGSPVLGDHDDRALYRSAHAFQILARTPAHKRGVLDPYPFELSDQEGFFVDSEFEFELAGAWLERRQPRGRS